MYLRFLLLEQKYLEHLESGSYIEALKVLQLELTPLQVRVSRPLVHYSSVQCSFFCSAVFVPYNIVQCSAVQCSAVQCCTVLYSALPSSTASPGPTPSLPC